MSNTVVGVTNVNEVNYLLQYPFISPKMHLDEKLQLERLNTHRPIKVEITSRSLQRREIINAAAYLPLSVLLA